MIDPPWRGRRGATAGIRLSLAVLVGVACAAAVETKTWRVESRQEMEGGNADGVSISGDGTLVLSPAVEEVFAAPEPIVASLALGPGGDLYIGTANKGRIYLSRGGREPEVLAEDLGLQVSALTVAPDGEVYAAWNPSGQVLRVLPGGKEVEVLSPEATYVWALAADGDGGLWVATGDPSLLLRLPPGGGEADEVLKSPEPNLTALALGADGAVYVGTEGEGLVLRVDPGGGRTRVVWDSELRQVSALAAAPDGSLYAAAIARPVTAKEEDTHGHKEDHSEPSEVVRIRPDGRVESLWNGKGEPVFSLALVHLDPDAGPVLLAGTGTAGRLFALEGEGRRNLLADTEQEQVTAIVPAGDGEAIFATANLARVLRLRRDRSTKGTYRSEPLDAAVLSDWGAFRWEGRTPTGASLRFETRSGTTARPDDTWSDWARVRNGAVRSPAARRLQWRAVLAADRGGTSPLIRSVEVSYLQRNLPPKVTAVTIHDPGLVYDKKLATQSIEEGGPDRFSSDVDPDQNSKPYHLPGWRTISWDASDPNGDRLRFRLDLKGVAEEGPWIALARGLEGEAFAWDARTLPDGRYDLRVTADDSPGNPPDLSLEGDRIAGPFLVDNTPPAVEALRARLSADGTVLSFRAVDEADVVASASVSVAGGAWRPLLPEDGIADQGAERFSASLADARPGDLVVVRLGDRTGNVRTASTTVR